MVESVSVHVNNGIVFSQYDVSGTSILDANSYFYNLPVTPGVYLLSWKEGLDYITAATTNSVS